MSVYSGLADCYKKLKNYSLAVTNYSKALGLIQKTTMRKLEIRLERGVTYYL